MKSDPKSEINGQLPNTEEVFKANADIERDYPAGVEGIEMSDGVWLKVVMKSDSMLMLQVFREKGVQDPLHRHDDHETSCHLVSGKLEVTVGEKSFTAEPGDTWFHPKGVDHTTKALQDSVQIEVKSPPVKTWISKPKRNL